MTTPTPGFQSAGKGGGEDPREHRTLYPSPDGAAPWGASSLGFWEKGCLLVGVRSRMQWDLLSAEGLCVFVAVCTCVLVHMNMCVHVSICVCVWLSVYVYGHILACMRVHVCAHTSVRCVYIQWGWREASFFVKRLCAIFPFSPPHLPLSSFSSLFRRREEEITKYHLGEVTGCGLGFSISSPGKNYICLLNKD